MPSPYWAFFEKCIEEDLTEDNVEAREERTVVKDVNYFIEREKRVSASHANEDGAVKKDIHLSIANRQLTAHLQLVSDALATCQPTSTSCETFFGG